MVRLVGRHRNIAVIQVYAPDSTHSGEEMEEYYELLELEITNVDIGGISVVMGYFNTKVADDPSGYEDVMGRHGLGRMNKRGERMLEFCQEKNLCISNTVFYHRLQRRYTYTHPDGHRNNCIDYILVQKLWKSSIFNNEMLRGADLDTPHGLNVLKVRVNF